MRHFPEPSLVRPLKPANDRASSAFRVRVTHAERALLDAKAAEGGTTKSEIVRAAALQYRPPPPPVTRGTLADLSAIRKILTEIALRLNTTGDLEDGAVLRDAISRLTATLDMLRGRGGKPEPVENS
jgi:hypothetical protein